MPCQPMPCTTTRRHGVVVSPDALALIVVVGARRRTRATRYFERGAAASSAPQAADMASGAMSGGVPSRCRRRHLPPPRPSPRKSRQSKPSLVPRAAVTLQFIQNRPVDARFDPQRTPCRRNVATFQRSPAGGNDDGRANGGREITAKHALSRMPRARCSAARVMPPKIAEPKRPGPLLQKEGGRR